MRVRSVPDGHMSVGVHQRFPLFPAKLKDDALVIKHHEKGVGSSPARLISGWRVASSACGSNLRLPL